MKGTIAVAVMVMLGALAGCNKDSGSGGAGGSGSAASGGGGGGGDSIGIKECDDYIAAWNNCYKDPTMKAAAKPAFDQVKTQWAQQAKDPQQKAGLQMACKAAADSLKQSGACK
jgi:hypothetical protein